jgi:hypothetical protein
MSANPLFKRIDDAHGHVCTRYRQNTGSNPVRVASDVTDCVTTDYLEIFLGIGAAL